LRADDEAPPAAPEPSPNGLDRVIDAYRPGIDLTLLRANLRLTPTERVRNLMALNRLLEQMRGRARDRR
jgi:hypothetical protein